jgi:hypothetical protein
MPDEVPTPLAIAIADYCRRAGQKPSGSQVRLALSATGSDDDFRLRALADSEPKVSPLGPFAAVDILWGAPPELAAARQSCGYYLLAEALLAASASQPSVAAQLPVEASPPVPPVTAPVVPPPPQTPAGTDAVAPPIESRNPLSGLSAFAPRGRFSRLASPKEEGQKLSSPDGRSILEDALLRYPHRFRIWRALSEQYASEGGLPLRYEEVEGAYRRHGLWDTLEKREREQLLGALLEHRGALKRVAWALGLSPPELTRLTSLLGLDEDIRRARERFAKEALAPQSLSRRLDLLGREKYLADLGIQARFFRSLKDDLRALLDSSLPPPAQLSAQIEALSLQERIPRPALQRAVHRLGLSPG